MTTIVVADIGGTHARFAFAELRGDGTPPPLGPATTLRTADHASFAEAWSAFASAAGRPLPREAAIALAAPITGDVLRLTNNPWAIQPAALPAQLGLDRLTLINDFGAVAHAVARCPEDALSPLCGPEGPLPTEGPISIIGPGSGLGVACLVRGPGGAYRVIGTEGGHSDFAPLDAVDDALLHHLRARHGRVSVERVVAGPGLAAIYETLAAVEVRPADPVQDDRALWTSALAGTDAPAVAALDRFCRCLGSVAGDIALTQGAVGVVIAGGLGARLADRLPQSGFADRFRAKGRFQALMATIPVRCIRLDEPGLFGAAVAHEQSLEAQDCKNIP